jgi:hypothetical protein
VASILSTSLKTGSYSGTPKGLTHTGKLAPSARLFWILLNGRELPTSDVERYRLEALAAGAADRHGLAIDIDAYIFRHQLVSIELRRSVSSIVPHTRCTLMRNKSPAPSCPLPANAPPRTRQRSPEQASSGRVFGVVVEGSGTLKEPSCVPRVTELEQVKIQMMAEFVAERVQEGSKRRDFLADSRSHPQPNQHGFDVVIPKQFGRPVFPDSQWSGGEYANTAGRDSVKFDSFSEKFRTGTTNVGCLPSLHCRLDEFRY